MEWPSGTWGMDGPPRTFIHVGHGEPVGHQGCDPMDRLRSHERPPRMWPCGQVMKDVGSEGSTKAMTSETDCREWRLNGPPRTWGMDGTSKVGARGQAMHGIGHGWITKDVWIWMAMQDMDGPLRTRTPKHAVQDSLTRSFFSLLDLPAFPLAHSRAKKAIVVLLKEKKQQEKNVAHWFQTNTAGNARKDVRCVLGTRGNPVLHAGCRGRSS